MRWIRSITFSVADIPDKPYLSADIKLLGYF